MSNSDTFMPDWASPPGATVVDILARRRLPKAEFAQRLGYTLSETNKLLQGAAPLTIDVAEKLEVILGPQAAFWTNREMQYRDDLARLAANAVTDAEWLKGLPVSDMTKFGWIPKVRSPAERVAACLRFFGVPDVSSWRRIYEPTLEMAAYRTSSSLKPRPGAVAAWLRQGELLAAQIDCGPWNVDLFNKTLEGIRSLTFSRDPSRFVPELTKRCAQCGIAIVIARAPAGCPASGATRFLSPTKALLLLSFRYLSDDHFWFTFFHEAGHLVLHGRKALFLEGIDITSREEGEANDFAARMLIPVEFQSELSNLGPNTREVIRFAQRVGVSPGVIVGQLQHLGHLRYEQMNWLKRRFRWD